MRRLIGLALVAVILIAAKPASAGGPQPFGNWLPSGNSQDPVEQESPDYFFGPRTAPETWVHNPTACTWDVDDHEGISTSGPLTGTVTGTVCSIADEYDNYGGDDKMVDALVYSPAAAITVTLSDNLGHTWSAAPVASGSGWRYAICHREHEQGPFAVIEGSNGGTGIEIDYTLTITSTKKVNGVAANLATWGWVSQYQNGCA